MFDSTITEENKTGFDGHLPYAFSFPFITQLSKEAERFITNIDGTLDIPQFANDFYTKLLNEIDQAFAFAYHTFQNLDKNRLELALREAKVLAKSGIFGDELFPNVSVDPYGEFTFSHRSNAGYIDIGVRGEGELSYHVRNDLNPDATAFDDFDWADYNVPKSLFTALNELRQSL